MSRGYFELSALILVTAIAASLQLLLLSRRLRPPVKIGVLNDQSGIYADLAGPGSVEAARMAIEDFGGQVLGSRLSS